MSDQLVSGTERVRRVPRRVVAAAAVVVLSGLGLDRLTVSRESAALTGCVRKGEAQVRYVQRKISATSSYASPLLSSAQTPPGVRRDLERLVQATAAEGIGPTELAASDCERLSVLPWHGARAAAGRRYAAYLRGEVAYLRAADADYDVLVTPRPGLLAQREAARAAVSGVLPDAGRLLSP